jgi:flavin-dependent dehydrogenase
MPFDQCQCLRDVLAMLGVPRAAFVRDDLHSEFNFADKFTVGHTFTFQVPRAEFDQVLANEAARRGATIRHEVEITAIDVSGERPVVTARAGDEVITHRPRFVLDVVAKIEAGLK